MTNRFQEKISQLVRARKANRTLMRRLVKQDVLLEKTAAFLKEVGVRPYIRKSTKKAKGRTKPTKASRQHLTLSI